jgi:hypothetical protein
VRLRQAKTPIAPTFRLLIAWRRHDGESKNTAFAQWTIGYVAVAYGIRHAVTLTSEAYEWPSIVARVSKTLLAVGLPLAITVAWYHGKRASRRVSGESGRSLRRINPND